jgi:hypothetical protein
MRPMGLSWPVMSPGGSGKRSLPMADSQAHLC